MAAKKAEAAEAAAAKAATAKAPAASAAPGSQPAPAGGKKAGPGPGRARATSVPDEAPAALPRGFFSEASTREALFRAGNNAVFGALAAWDGGRWRRSGKAEHEREQPSETRPYGRVVR